MNRRNFLRSIVAMPAAAIPVSAVAYAAGGVDPGPTIVGPPQINIRGNSDAATVEIVRREIDRAMLRQWGAMIERNKRLYR